jgi:hypothetical protein
MTITTTNRYLILDSVFRTILNSSRSTTEILSSEIRRGSIVIDGHRDISNLGSEEVAKINPTGHLRSHLINVMHGENFCKALVRIDMDFYRKSCMNIVSMTDSSISTAAQDIFILSYCLKIAAATPESTFFDNIVQVLTSVIEKISEKKNLVLNWDNISDRERRDLHALTHIPAFGNPSLTEDFMVPFESGVDHIEAVLMGLRDRAVKEYQFSFATSTIGEKDSIDLTMLTYDIFTENLFTYLFSPA